MTLRELADLAIKNKVRFSIEPRTFFDTLGNVVITKDLYLIVNSIENPYKKIGTLITQELVELTKPEVCTIAMGDLFLKALNELKK